MFEILSWRAALEDPPGLTPPVYPQAQWDPVDIDVMVAGGLGQGVVFGAAVSPSSPEALTVDVAAGRVVIDGTAYDVAETADLALASTPNLTQPRFDLVLVDDSGDPFCVSGVPATHSPPFPSLPSDAVALASIYVAAGLEEILAAHLVDKRWPVDEPAAASAGWQTITATADATRSNTSSCAIDDVLQFAVSPNTKYRVKGRLIFSALAASDLRYGFLSPASPSFLAIEDHFAHGSSTALIPRVITAPDSTGRTVSLTANFTAVAEFSGVVHNGSNSGVFGVGWGQLSAVAENTVRRAGSTLEWEEVS